MQIFCSPAHHPRCYCYPHTQSYFFLAACWTYYHSQTTPRFHSRCCYYSGMQIHPRSKFHSIFEFLGFACCLDCWVVNCDEFECSFLVLDCALWLVWDTSCSTIHRSVDSRDSSWDSHGGRRVRMHCTASFVQTTLRFHFEEVLRLLWKVICYNLLIIRFVDVRLRVAN